MDSKGHGETLCPHFPTSVFISPQMFPSSHGLMCPRDQSMGKCLCGAILQVAASVPGLYWEVHSAHRQWETGTEAGLQDQTLVLGTVRSHKDAPSVLPGLYQVPWSRYHPCSPPPHQGPTSVLLHWFLIPKMFKVLEILVTTPEPFPALTLLPVEEDMGVPRHPVLGWHWGAD